MNCHLLKQDLVIIDGFLADFFDTLWFVLGGCDRAVLAAAFPELEIGCRGDTFAFDLTFWTIAYAISHIAGCHLKQI